MKSEEDIKKEHYNAVKEIEFINLKGLRNSTISFSPSLNCIIGANGTGKSTILHALACVYQAKRQNDKNNLLEYPMSKFFTPYSGTSWQDSKFIVRYYGGAESLFTKTDRWLPRREQKRRRDTIYLGINTGVPSIERESRKSIIRLSKQQSLDEGIKKALNEIMSENYVDVFHYKDSSNKKYIGVSKKSQNNDTTQHYCSLSLSAGTQRCLQILMAVFGARKGSLILIEELDMLLHVNALLKLVKTLDYKANENNLQIVFTCHNPEIKNTNNLNFVCLQKCSSGITALQGFMYYNIFEIMGRRNIKIKLLCEDNLSIAILKQVVKELKISHMTQITKFGTAQNAVTILGALQLMDELDTGLILAVLDGDVYKNDDDLKEIYKRLFPGCDRTIRNNQNNVLSHLIMYDNPKGIAPEKYIVEALKENRRLYESEHDELLETLFASSGHQNHHDDFKETFAKLGWLETSGNESIVALFAKTPQFKDFTKQIRSKIIDFLKQGECEKH